MDDYRSRKIDDTHTELKGKLYDSREGKHDYERTSLINVQPKSVFGPHIVFVVWAYTFPCDLPTCIIVVVLSSSMSSKSSGLVGSCLELIDRDLRRGLCVITVKLSWLPFYWVVLTLALVEYTSTCLELKTLIDWD